MNIYINMNIYIICVFIYSFYDINIVTYASLFPPLPIFLPSPFPVLTPLPPILSLPTTGPVSVRVCALRLCRSLLPPVSPDLLDLATEKLVDGAHPTNDGAHNPSVDGAHSPNGFALALLHGIGDTLNVWGRLLQGRCPWLCFSPPFSVVLFPLSFALPSALLFCRIPVHLTIHPDDSHAPLLSWPFFLRLPTGLADAGSGRARAGTGQCARDELSVAQCQTSLLLSLLTHSPTWADHIFSQLDTALTQHLPSSLESLQHLASGRVTDVRKSSPKPLDLCVAALTLLGGGFPTSVFGTSVAYRTSAGEVGEGTMLRRRVRGGEDGEASPTGPPEGEGPSEVVTILPANHAELVEVRRQDHKTRD